VKEITKLTDKVLKKFENDLSEYFYQNPKLVTKESTVSQIIEYTGALFLKIVIGCLNQKYE
jgi:hydroxyethylthiazole kinase-like sugar kinase family protein